MFCVPYTDKEIKMAKIVDFFKCYFPETSAQTLQLPTAFSLQLQGALPDRAFLRDRYANLWPVKMTKIENNWFFEDGWEKFVQDNSMEKRDVFVFKYDGDNLFDVKLLGMSGCEKKGVGEFRMSVKEETAYKGVDYEEIEDDGEVEDIHDSDDNDDDYLQYEEEEDEDVEAEEDNVEDGEEVDIDSKDDDCYFNTEEQKIETEADSKAEELQVSDDGASEDDDMNSKEDDPDEYIEEEQENKIEEDGEEEAKQVANDGDRHVRGRKPIVDPYGNDIFATGLVQKPKNPYFVTRTRKARKDELFIPREVIDDFQVPLPDKMILIDPEGRKWETNLCIWKDGRPWYRGGWKNLCRVNFVCEDDRCICEFVKGKGREGLCLHVNIVKAKKD
ncbi:putative B3 domain-containing protein [Abeliophyllum distichum]|uniref:B3 domain-containing protein n=1 Tax=Abeliophyllum distichum TaxID=126358 RepID=A0ABD1SYP0_9LAMI